jgi:hypothetical protein
MIHPTQADIGRHVIYRERGDFSGRKVEEGVLTSFNERSAFVRYRGCSPAATDLADLEWARGQSAEILATLTEPTSRAHTCKRCGMTIRANEPIPCWHRDCPEPSAN